MLILLIVHTVTMQYVYKKKYKNAIFNLYHLYRKLSASANNGW